MSEFSKPCIEVKKLTKTFDERLALRGVDLQIEAGESVVIFGPNGAGKTTLIKILSTIMNPTSGTILVDGLNIKDNPEKVRRKIGVVSHNTFLYGHLTAYENLDFYRRLYNLNVERISEVADLVGMKLRLTDRINTLSRGMQQRFSIARALLHSPSIMLLDEPETGLDQQAISMLWSVFRSNNGKKRTIVFTTHNFDRGMELADRAIIISQGKIVYQTSKDAMDLTGLRETYRLKTRASV